MVSISGRMTWERSISLSLPSPSTSAIPRGFVLGRRQCDAIYRHQLAELGSAYLELNPNALSPIRMGRTKRDTLVRGLNRPIIPKIDRGTHMAANQVVVFFDKQEDAVLFTLAASSLMSAEGSAHSSKAAVRVAAEICKASRIKTEGV